MILQLIERYFYVYWLLFILTAGIKIVFAVMLNGKIYGITDIFAILFKWYNRVDLSLEDLPSRRTRLRFQNLLTLGMCFFLFIIIGVFILKKII